MVWCRNASRVVSGHFHQQFGAAYGNQGDTVEEVCFRRRPVAPAKIDRHINIRMEEVDRSGRGTEPQFDVGILFLKVADSRHQPACEKGRDHTDVDRADVRG